MIPTPPNDCFHIIVTEIIWFLPSCFLFSPFQRHQRFTKRNCHHYSNFFCFFSLIQDNRRKRKIVSQITTKMSSVCWFKFFDRDDRKMPLEIKLNWSWYRIINILHQFEGGNRNCRWPESFFLFSFRFFWQFQRNVNDHSNGFRLSVGRLRTFSIIFFCLFPLTFWEVFI